MPVWLTPVFVFGFIISFFFLIHYRRKKGITGFKTALTPITFYLIGIINLIHLWIGLNGILLWILNISLLFLAAYFTKFLPGEKQPV